MAHTPQAVAEFLKGKRFAVAGVSRGKESAANPVFRKLRDSGYEVFPVNPNTAQVEGVSCYANLAAILGELDGVVIATHPNISLQIVQRRRKGRFAGFGFTARSGRGAFRKPPSRNAKNKGLPALWAGVR